MNKFARLTHNSTDESYTAVEVIDFDPEGRFHPDVVAMFEDVPEDVVVGSIRKDDEWTHPATPEPSPFPPNVPTVVFMRQARLALLHAGVYAQVESFIDSMDEPERTATRIEWEYATEVRRDHPLIAGIGHALDLTDEQIDDLFIAAAQID